VRAGKQPLREVLSLKVLILAYKVNSSVLNDLNKNLTVIRYSIYSQILWNTQFRYFAQHWTLY
jgi:hypothetical protein